MVIRAPGLPQCFFISREIVGPGLIPFERGSGGEQWRQDVQD
jgi:hypothetical protein